MSKPSWTDQAAPSLEDLSRLGEAALAALPDPFRGMAKDVLIRVDDFPPQDILDELSIEDGFELTGLYSGMDIAHRDGPGPAAEPSWIFLYRLPILAEWAERGDLTLTELVTHVLVHEIGHHVGLSDDDIHRIEDD